MSEHSIAQARASVMLYNNEIKQWTPSGESQGISRVHVYHHPVNNTYRIVGRKVADHAVVINCALARGLKYNEATPTFHQWRDQRQVYGLNFQSREEADLFGQAVREALETLASTTAAPAPARAPQPQPQPQPQSQQQYQTSYQSQSQQDNVSNGRGNEQDDLLSQIRHRQAFDHDSQDNYQRSRVATAVGQDKSYRAQYDAQSSGGASEPEILSSSQASVPSSSAITITPQSSAPPAPTPPPTPPVPVGPPAPPAPPAAPPVPSVGGPPVPPPPPPPPSGGGGGGGGGGTLSDQLAATRLRKSSRSDSNEGGMRTERSGSMRGTAGSAVGGMDMMAEMAKKLAARRAKSEDPKPDVNGPAREDTDSKNERSSPMSRANTNPSQPPVFPSSSKTNFKTTNSKPEGRLNSSKSEGALSSDQLEAFKSELLADFRRELDAFKREIVEAVRQEVSRYR